MLKRKTQKPKLVRKTISKLPSQKDTKPKRLLRKKSIQSNEFKRLYDNFICKEDYENAGIKWIEPMTAKEPLDDKMLEEMLNDNNVVAEDKLDGTRCLLHIVDGKVRLFSRTVSKKTGWFTENSDRIPHLRDLEVPEGLGYTVIDGELKIPDKPFETVSSILNCLPEEAVERQKTSGKIVLNVFDILWYDGECVEDRTLTERKKYLAEFLAQVDTKYLPELHYFTANTTVKVSDELFNRYKINRNGEMFSAYPKLYEAFRTQYTSDWDRTLILNKAEYYEYVVAQGGEGIMLKNPNGKYYHKRGREFTKYKKFLTRDCVVMQLSEPTREYTGKELKSWSYWEDNKGNTRFAVDENQVKTYIERGYTPVTKPYYCGWFGNAVFGVVVTPEDIKYLEKVNGKAFKDLEIVTYADSKNPYKVLIVGECAGFDDLTKQDYTEHPEKIVGKVIEVKCNEVFKKTGKLRHPRFMRVRDDKTVDMCLFQDHIQSDGSMNE